MKLHSIGFTVEKNDQIVKHGIKHSISAIQNDPSKIAFTYILRVEFSKHVLVHIVDIISMRSFHICKKHLCPKYQSMYKLTKKLKLCYF